MRIHINGNPLKRNHKRFIYTVMKISSIIACWVALFLICPSKIANCQNISGNWLGSITIPGYNGNEYPIEASVIQKDSLISGQIKSNYEGSYAIMKFQGIVSKNKIVINENEVIEDSYPNQVWCLKSFDGEYVADSSNRTKILGTYSGYTKFFHNRYTADYCVPGSFILLQKKPATRDIVIFKDGIKNIKKEEPLSQYNSKYGISYLVSISLHFEQSTSNLLESSIENLNKIVNCLSENRSVKIILESHTDNVGDLQKNFRLAEDRVARVKRYFLDKNILGSRVQCRILGPFLPIAPNDSEHNRSLNRRVVVKVKDL